MKLFVNIKNLVQIRDQSEKIVPGKLMAKLPSLSNAWLAIDQGKITDFGTMNELQSDSFKSYERIDCSGKIILPCWVDSHTHIVFAEWREQEFVGRIKGLTYEEIAANGGGILNSAKKMKNASEDALFDAAYARLLEVIALGTGAIEIKSGYGLSTETEMKMLRVIKRIKEASPIPVKSTFLGAHAFPAELKETPEVYVRQIIEEMLPTIAADNLADYIDAFCEEGYFSVDQTKRILEAGAKYGLKAKVHVNQFNAIGGVEMCAQQGALSVDHLEVMPEADIKALEGSDVIPVSLPSCSFFLGIPYTPAREIMAANLPLALATDFNPGSTPTGNMNFIVSLACIKMKMTPEEAINAATLNAAAAIELSAEVGSITRGKKANLILTKEIPSLEYLPYAFGSNSIDQVYINGDLMA